jgi:beta-hydroxylase
MPNFYDTSTLSSTKILEDNYEIIKKEVLEFYDREGEDMKPNFFPQNYVEEGWRTIDIMSFMMKYHHRIDKFPKTWEIVNKIPNVVSMQVAVLKPHTRIKAHFGDSNAIIRNHLGLVIPGKYPELGFRNGSQERCWEEGKVLSLCISHRHYVWNNTDNKRIILLVDTIHDNYANKKLYICAGLLAAGSLKIITTAMPWTKKTPQPIVYLLHKIFTLGFMVGLPLQNMLRFGDIFNKFKMDL